MIEKRLNIFKLILPVIVPSWRFFDIVKPAPRIEYCVSKGAWIEFRPRPERLTLIQSITRLFWNPHWNERLFLMSCAERIINGQIEHSVEEIKARLMRDLGREVEYPLQFPLAFISRHEGEIRKDILYISKPFTAEGV